MKCLQVGDLWQFHKGDKFTAKILALKDGWVEYLILPGPMEWTHEQEAFKNLYDTFVGESKC